MRKSKRAIAKSKTYGFNPWLDQVDGITKIMNESGERAEAVMRSVTVLSLEVSLQHAMERACQRS